MSHPFALFNQGEYDELIHELNQKVQESQPEDILQFCTTFFLQKLQHERAQAREHPPGLDEEMEDRLEEMPDLALPISRGRRTSVSAESLQPSRQRLKVIPKSPQQRVQIRTALQNNFLFKDLDDDMIEAMDQKRVEAGTRVIEQGAVGDFFYIVLEGQLECWIEGELVTSYGPGGSFGELALMYNAPRAASIVAVTECVLYTLDRVTFRSILMDTTARKRQMYEAFLDQVPIFKSLEAYERHKIADALESVTFEPQQVVVREGDVGDQFYLIEEGEAIFYKNLPDGSKQELMVGKKGDYFGELALLNDKPRAASVIAHGQLKCATLSKKAFTRLLGPVMDILKRNSENYRAVLQQAS